MRERELKFVVADDFDPVVLERSLVFAEPGSTEAVTLHDRYFDTDDLRLVRWGVTLRFREGVGWTLKLPRTTGRGGLVDREELVFDGPPDTPPSEVRSLVVGYTRQQPLVEIAVISHDRTTRTWHGHDDQTLVEVADDLVRGVADGAETRFREVEIEFAPGVDDATIDRVSAGLATLGDTTAPLPKLVRVLGPRALEPPDVVVPSLSSDPTGAEVIRRAIAVSVSRLMMQLPVAGIGEDPEGVHQARVATRRLRSDLRTFGPLLDRAWARQLRSDLRWLADALGGVRDADVLLLRLTQTLAEHPEIDHQAGDAIRAVLVSQRDRAHRDLKKRLSDDQAVDLLDALVAAASLAPVRARANRPGRVVLPHLVDRSWQQLRAAVDALDDPATPEALHRVRILAKRVRYATETVAPAAGKKARRFADAAAEIQDLLGDVHDAAVAAQWLDQAAMSASSTAAAFAAGRLAQQLHVDAANLGGAWHDAYERMKHDRSWMTKH